MSGNPLEIQYWDACVFLAWLKEKDTERSDANYLLGIEEQVKKISDNKAQLTTSVITITEVLENTLDPAKADLYRRLFERKNVTRFAVSGRVASLAAEIRSFYRDQRSKSDEPVMKTPDAIHLATAIICKCDVFYTFDGDGKKAKPFTLLNLSGLIAGKYQLRIEKPIPTPKPPTTAGTAQMSLFDDQEPQDTQQTLGEESEAESEARKGNVETNIEQKEEGSGNVTAPEEQSTIEEGAIKIEPVGEDTAHE